MNLYQQILISDNIELKDFINKHNLNEGHVFKNRLIFEQYLNEFIKCSDDSDLNNCKQIVSGYTLSLAYDNGRVYIVMNDCSHQLAWKKANKIEFNYLLRHFGDELLNLTIADLKNPNNEIERNEIINSFLGFIKEPTHTGLYIYGKPGTGKTFISTIFANKLAEMSKKVVFVFVPQLVQELKQTFKHPGMFDKMMDNLKQCDVLFLDDIAGESISEWFRDDILFNILNYRMLKKLPTFFTSNYSLKELFNYYKHNKNNSIEVIKATRLLERIRVLAKSIQLKGIILREYKS